MIVTMLYFLSCTSQTTDISFVFGEQEEQETTIETIGEWSIGAVESCTADSETPSWWDASTLLWGDDRSSDNGQPAGCIALYPEGDEWLVARTTKHINLRWGYLYQEEVNDVLVSPSSVRLRVEDIDGDGELDAIILDRSLNIGWSFTTDHGHWEELIPKSWDCSLRDLAVADIDGDRDLDLIVPGLGGCSQQTWTGALLENLGDQQFSTAQEMTISEDVWGVLFDAIAVDIDGDLDLDIYMCNDFGNEIAPNGWLYNDDGTFYDDDQRNSDIVAHCMGASLADINQDGRLDMYIAGNGNQFLLIDSPDGWIESQALWNMPSFDSFQMAWGSQFSDFNNDGLIDLMVSTSDFAQSGHLLFPVWFLEQIAPGTFEERGSELGFPQEAGGRGIIAYDINQDGVLDFLIADAFGEPWMFLSESCTQNNWIEVEAPRGSIVRIEAEGQQWTMLATTDPGFAVSQPSFVHVGLGRISKIDLITVTIPYVGTAQLTGPIQARRRLRVHGL